MKAEFIYTVEIFRELEDAISMNVQFAKEPTRDDILSYIDSLDCGYDDNYGKFYYEPISISYFDNINN